MSVVPFGDFDYQNFETEKQRLLTLVENGALFTEQAQATFNNLQLHVTKLIFHGVNVHTHPHGEWKIEMNHKTVECRQISPAGIIANSWAAPSQLFASNVLTLSLLLDAWSYLAAEGIEGPFYAKLPSISWMQLMKDPEFEAQKLAIPNIVLVLDPAADKQDWDRAESGCRIISFDLKNPQNKSVQLVHAG